MLADLAAATVVTCRGKAAPLTRLLRAVLDAPRCFVMRTSTCRQGTAEVNVAGAPGRGDDVQYLRAISGRWSRLWSLQPGESDMAPDHALRPVVLKVRAGELAGTGSWLYAWLAVPGGDVLYVGATGLPPMVRTWLHLNDADPAVGRVAARLPAVLRERVDVLAFALPAQVDRTLTKAGLVAALSAAGLLSAHYAGDPAGTPSALAGEHDQIAAIVAAIRDHRPDVI